MKTLLVGYRAADLFERGKHGKTFTAKWITEGDVTCHTLDIYHRHAIEKTHHLKTVCSAHLPEGDWELVKFRTGPKIHSGELALDLLQEVTQLAKKTGAKVEIDFDGKERDRNDFLDKIRKDPDRVRDFKATWRTSVPGLEPIELASFPGCFCHRRPDEGGLALAEVACKDLAEAGAPRILDMGCGCGLVGLLLVKSLTQKGGQPSELVLVDSHARAVEATELNAQTLGVAAEVILADNGTPSRMDGTFDVFVGNPPYYSDYRIADVFLETAKRALKPGGVCYTVCKNAAGLEPVQKRYFPEAEIIKRRGYAVLKSVKPQGDAPCS